MTREPVRFYACGGDGTLNEVFSGAYRYPDAQVACVPLGSGNDFVKNFGTAEEFLDLEDNIAGIAVPVDLMQVGESQISAAICSVGLDAAVAYSIPHFRRLPLCGGTMMLEDFGVVDPTKVTRSALQNASSVAEMVLTTESLVADIPEKEPAAPAADPSMGGM